jgi:hypothetical protein
MEIYDNDGEIITDEQIFLEKSKEDFQNIYNMDDSATDFNCDIQRYSSNHRVGNLAGCVHLIICLSE